LSTVRFEVVELQAEDTYPLRRTVLRTGTPSEDVVFDGDELDSTFHLGMRATDGTPVAVSTWMQQPYPDRPGDRAFQLRGMATVEALRGEGLGASLLEAGIDRCRAAGAVLVWARARDAALPFYARHGFRTIGLGYVDLTTALAHHDVIRELA
jgi:GNAT superfamily N-acetyltransferase